MSGIPVEWHFQAMMVDWHLHRPYGSIQYGIATNYLLNHYGPEHAAELVISTKSHAARAARRGY